MSRRIVPCRVTDEYVQGAGVVVGAAGSHNDVALRLEFSPLWAGTARSIVWKDALGENPTVTILTTDLLEEGETEVYLVPIPAEPKAAAGELSMTIKGATVSGETETSATLSATAHFIILESDWDEDAAESGDVNATQAEQLRSEIEDIKETIVEASTAADAAEGYANEAKEHADAARAEADKATEAAAASIGATISVRADGRTLVFMTKEGFLEEITVYNGDYAVKASLGGEDTVLETKKKILTDNITVEAIDQTEISNTAGGKTLAIGG